MGATSRALGQGSTFEYKGKTYSVSPWTFDIQSKFELYLESQAVKAARRMRQYLSEEEYRETLKAVNRDIACGVYTFGSDKVAEAINTSMAHFQYLLWLQVVANHPEVTLDLIREFTMAKLDEAMDAATSANAGPASEESADPLAKAGPES